MPWLLGSLGLPGRRKDTHQLMSRVDYGFNQWSVVSFVIKKLYVYLFMVKQCIYLVILMYFMLRDETIEIYLSITQCARSRSLSDPLK